MSHSVACNDLQYRAEDVIDILYGHNCGDPDRFPGRCDLRNGQNTGGCSLFPQQRGYFFDVFREGNTAAGIRQIPAMDIEHNVSSPLLSNSLFTTSCEYVPRS